MFVVWLCVLMQGEERNDMKMDIKNLVENFTFSGYRIGEPIYPFQICHIDGLSNMVVLMCVNDIASPSIEYLMQVYLELPLEFCFL
jgi:hypothetical protein